MSLPLSPPQLREEKRREECGVLWSVVVRSAGFPKSPPELRGATRCFRFVVCVFPFCGGLLPAAVLFILLVTWSLLYRESYSMLRRTAVTAKALRMTVRNKSTSEIMKYLTTPPYTLPNNVKLVAPPMVYISGEEMTRYTMELMYEAQSLCISNLATFSFYSWALLFSVWSSGSSPMLTFRTGSSMIFPARLVTIRTTRFWRIAWLPASALALFSRSPL